MVSKKAKIELEAWEWNIITTNLFCIAMQNEIADKNPFLVNGIYTICKKIKQGTEKEGIKNPSYKVV